MTGPDGTADGHADVFVVGASRGIGLALVAEHLRRGARVVATVRSTGADALREAARGVPGGADRLEVEHVDTTDVDQVRALGERLRGRTFDLLLVNAGVTHDRALTAADVDEAEFSRVLLTNALAPVRLVELLDHVVAPDGTVALMSSGQGSVSRSTGGGWEIYRASKAALNQLVRSYAARHRDDGRTVLLLAPGWVRTDLGGDGAASTVDEAVPPLVATVEAQRRRTGLHFLDRDGRTVAW